MQQTQQPMNPLQQQMLYQQFQQMQQQQNPGTAAVNSVDQQKQQMMQNYNQMQQQQQQQLNPIQQQMMMQFYQQQQQQNPNIPQTQMQDASAVQNGQLASNVNGQNAYFNQFYNQQQLMMQQQQAYQMHQQNPLSATSVQTSVPQQQNLDQNQVLNPFQAQQALMQQQQQPNIQINQIPLTSNLTDQKAQQTHINQWQQQVNHTQIIQQPIQQQQVPNVQMSFNSGEASFASNSQDQSKSNQQRISSNQVQIDTNTLPKTKPKTKQDKKSRNISKDEQLLASIDPAILYSTDQKTRYSIIYEFKNDKDEDIVCDVCLDDHIEEERGKNEILICELCNSAVHQSCYGNEILDNFPQGSWYCMRCQYLRTNPEANAATIRCQFCNDLKGMIIRDQKNVWAHITCVNWIPDVWYKDDYRNLIDGNFNSERNKLTCYICRKKNTGSCIQCDYKNCQQAFHVRCGINSQLIRDYESMDDQRENEDDYECYVFCDKHVDVGKRDLRLGGKERLKETGINVQIEEKLKKFGLRQHCIKNNKKRNSKQQVDDTFIADKSSDSVEDEKMLGDDEDSEEKDTNEDDDEDEQAYSGKYRFNRNRSSKKIKKCKSKSSRRFKNKGSKSKHHRSSNGQQYQNNSNGFNNSASNGNGIDMQNQATNFMMMMQAFLQMQQQQQQQQPLQFQNQIIQQAYPQQQQQQQNQIQTTLSHNRTSRANNNQIQQVAQPPNQISLPPIYGNQNSLINQNNGFSNPHIQTANPHIQAAFQPQTIPSVQTFTAQNTAAPQGQFGSLPPNTSQKLTRNQKRGQQKHSPKQDAQLKEYYLEPDFGQLIKIQNDRATRKEIQNAFISFAIDAGIVDMETRNYEIFKVPYLYQRLGVDKVAPQDIFKNLKKILKPVEISE